MRDCTCVGSCRGAKGLGPGWKCALDDGPREGVTVTASGTHEHMNRAMLDALELVQGGRREPLDLPLVVGRKLTVLEWARERYANTLRLAGEKTGADREGWLEDAAYWREIVALISWRDE